MSKKTETLPDSINSREFSRWAWENNLRIEWILALACASETDGECCEKLRDLIEFCSDEQLGKLFGAQLIKSLEERKKEEAQYGGEWDEEEQRAVVCEYLVDKDVYGFVVEVSTPVMRHSSSGGRSYSWGYTHNEKIYSDGLNRDFVEKLSAWLDQMRKADKKESAREKATR